METGQREELFGEIRASVRARRTRTVGLLQSLVRVPSPSGDEAAVQEVVAEALAGCGLAVERCETTTEQVTPYAEHVGPDIKPEGRPNILGVKGGLATIISALGALEAVGIGLRGDVTVAATVGEEDTGVGALATVLAGYRADAAVITEPTRLRLVPAQAGSLVFRITVRGRAVHASARHRGVSAFEKFLPIFEM